MQSKVWTMAAVAAVAWPLWGSPAVGEGVASSPQAAEASAKASAKAGAEAGAAVGVARVEERVLEQGILASGSVRAADEIRVAPLVEGQAVEALWADVGDRVEKDQVLATLSRAALTVELRQAEASAAQARAGVAQARAQEIEARAAWEEAERVAVRAATLQESGTGSQATADQALAAATSAKARWEGAQEGLKAAQALADLGVAQLETARLRFDRAEVKAPAAGVIIARDAVVGAIPSGAGAPMFVLAKDGVLEAALEVSEGDIRLVEAGQEVRLSAVGLEGVEGALVGRVDPALDATTRLGRVIVPLDGVSSGWRVGMYVEGRITVETRAAVAVPETAVLHTDAGAVAVRVEGRTARHVPVETGISEGGWIEVEAGLSAGDTVVALAGAFVADGVRVRPVPWEGSVGEGMGAVRVEDGR